MGTFICFLAFVIITVSVCIWVSFKRDSDIAPAIGVTVGTVGFFILLFMGVGLFEDAPDMVDAFIFEKPYIQGSDNYLLIEKRNDWNEWLRGAQRSKERFGWFSFQPDEVLTLTPIE